MAKDADEHHPKAVRPGNLRLAYTRQPSVLKSECFVREHYYPSIADVIKSRRDARISSIPRNFRNQTVSAFRRWTAMAAILDRGFITRLSPILVGQIFKAKKICSEFAGIRQIPLPDPVYE